MDANSRVGQKSIITEKRLNRTLLSFSLFFNQKIKNNYCVKKIHFLRNNTKKEKNIINYNLNTN